MEHFPPVLAHDAGKLMTLDPTRLLIAFKNAQSRQEVEQRLQSTGVGLVLEDAEDKRNERLPRPMEVVNHTNHYFWVRTQQGKPIDQGTFNTIQEALGVELDWIGPVYRLSDITNPNLEGRRGLLCPLPNVLVIKPLQSLPPEAETEWLATLKQLGLQEVPEKSKYLGDYRYFIITAPNGQTAYQLQPILLSQEGHFVQEALFEEMPLIVPIAAVPDDPLFQVQWNMKRIQAGGQGTTGWDISTGAATIVVCILDTGCDLTHPDLQFSTPGINLGTMAPDGRPNNPGRADSPHGTCCAGIAAAVFNNGLGVTGVAGNCPIMPLAIGSYTAPQVAAGIRYAADQGARVISMSFDILPSLIVDSAIQYAFNKGVVMCACTQNQNSTITYPATNPLVIACGASDENDERKTPTSPDGENWGSNYGPEMSVVAPGVHIWTTDIQGSGGYNIAGDYVDQFGGTSAATPHVAGLAALIRSQYLTLTNVQVRSIIERTAEKVGRVPYAVTLDHPNGIWNQEMGYGRINVFRALDFADVMIKDWSGDTGIEPSTPEDEFADIVARISDDNVFIPSDNSKSQYVKRGQTNYLYIRVTNNGPRDARNVEVDARITPPLPLTVPLPEFAYPQDWTRIDATHVKPTPVTATFASIPAGGSVIAKFTISPTQVEILWGWDKGIRPICLLAKVTADNDYAFASADFTAENTIRRLNNLARRDLSF